MDTFILLLFMAIFYLGPALLKRYRAKINTQPAEPELLNSEIRESPPENKREVFMASATRVQSTTETHIIPSVPAIVEEQSAWHGKLEHNMITNGVIFAEILQPPRAYRPFVKR